MTFASVRRELYEHPYFEKLGREIDGTFANTYSNVYICNDESLKKNSGAGSARRAIFRNVYRSKAERGLRLRHSQPLSRCATCKGSIFMVARLGDKSQNRRLKK